MKVDENICDATSISDAAILTYRASPAMPVSCVGGSKSGSVDSSGASGGPCCSCCQVEHKYWAEVGVFNQLLMIDMHYIQFNIKYVLFKIVNQSNEYISYWPWFIWGTQALLLPINWNWGKEEVNIGFVDTEKLITQSAKQRSWSIWRPGSTVHSYWGNTGVGC